MTHIPPPALVCSLQPTYPRGRVAGRTAGHPVGSIRGWGARAGAGGSSRRRGKRWLQCAQMGWVGVEVEGPQSGFRPGQGVHLIVR